MKILSASLFVCRKKGLSALSRGGFARHVCGKKARLRKLMTENVGRSAKTILLNLMIYRRKAAGLFVQNYKWGNVHIMSLCIS